MNRSRKRMRIMSDAQRLIFQKLRAANGAMVPIEGRELRTAESLIKRRAAVKVKGGFALHKRWIEVDTWWVFAEYVGYDHVLDAKLRKCVPGSSGSGFGFGDGRRDISWAFTSEAKAKAAVARLRTAFRGRHVRVKLDTPAMQKRRERKHSFFLKGAARLRSRFTS